MDQEKMSALAATFFILISIIGTICGLVASSLLILLVAIGYAIMFIVNQCR